MQRGNHPIDETRLAQSISLAMANSKRERKDKELLFDAMFRAV